MSVRDSERTGRARAGEEREEGGKIYEVTLYDRNDVAHLTRIRVQMHIKQEIRSVGIK